MDCDLQQRIDRHWLDTLHWSTDQKLANCKSRHAEHPGVPHTCHTPGC
jgi:hypothetical protein